MHNKLKLSIIYLTLEILNLLKVSVLLNKCKYQAIYQNGSVINHSLRHKKITNTSWDISTVTYCKKRENMSKIYYYNPLLVKNNWMYDENQNSR